MLCGAARVGVDQTCLFKAVMEESEQELFDAPDVEPGPMGGWALSVGGYGGPVTLLGRQLWPWDRFHPGRAGHGCPGRRLWVLVVGARFLLCPSQDPVRGLVQAVLGGWAPRPALLLSSQEMFSAQCGLSADWEYAESVIPYSARIHPYQSCCGFFFLSFPLHLLLEHSGNGYNVKMKNAYSLL